MDSAKALLRRAIANFKNRDPRKVAIPKASQPLVAGFSVAAIKYMLGGTLPRLVPPAQRRHHPGPHQGHRGHRRLQQSEDEDRLLRQCTLTRELIQRDVLVLKTGCAAIASAKEGMLTPEAALEVAGPGFREVCEAVGIPPVLHMGSCVDNSRLLEAATEVVLEGGWATTCRRCRRSASPPNG
jgi:carbon-monoxide dehydrogenase catalytic subunit